MLDTSFNGLAALSGTFLGLTTASIVLRFYARHRQKAPLQMDDWLTIPAWIFFVGLTAISFFGLSQKFMGYPQPHDMRLVNEIHPEMEKIYVSIDAIALLAFGSVKLSALFFYRRIFCTGTKGAFNLITMISIVLVALWTVTFFVMTFLLCGPNINFLWVPGNTAKCWLVFRYFLGTTISDFVLDVFILGLPIPKIWSLHTTTKRKIAISAVFLLALAGLGASTARMVITIHLVTVGRAVDDEDSFQSNTQWAYYVILEAGLTLVAVNLPSLWYYLAGVTPERVLRSVRSLVSLGSHRSSQGSAKKGSRTDKPAAGNGSTRDQSLDTNSSTTQLGDRGAQDLAYPEGRFVETYAMRDLPGHPDPDVERGTQGIQVNHSIRRIEERVRVFR